MATCEMCGGDGPLKKTKVEGTTLKLCEDCQSVGDVVESPSGSVTRSRSSSSSRRSRSGGGKDLAPDVGKRVKRAREENGLSVSALADRLKEKDSVVRRIESGKLTPDRSLARKLERKLDVDLYEEAPEVSQGSSSETSEATIGDVADVRKQD